MTYQEYDCLKLFQVETIFIRKHYKFERNALSDTILDKFSIDGSQLRKNQEKPHRGKRMEGRRQAKMIFYLLSP